MLKQKPKSENPPVASGEPKLNLKLLESANLMATRLAAAYRNYERAKGIMNGEIANKTQERADEGNIIALAELAKLELMLGYREKAEKTFELADGIFIARLSQYLKAKPEWDSLDVNALLKGLDWAEKGIARIELIVGTSVDEPDRITAAALTMADTSLALGNRHKTQRFISYAFSILESPGFRKVAGDAFADALDLQLKDVLRKQKEGNTQDSGGFGRIPFGIDGVFSDFIKPEDAYIGSEEGKTRAIQRIDGQAESAASLAVLADTLRAENLALAYAYLGETAKARTIVEAVEDVHRLEGNPITEYCAIVRLLIGDIDKALEVDSSEVRTVASRMLIREAAKSLTP